MDIAIKNLGTPWAVVDLDTGTVVGTNLALVLMPENVDELLDSDSAAIEYAEAQGLTLYADEISVVVTETQ